MKRKLTAAAAIITAAFFLYGCSGSTAGDTAKNTDKASEKENITVKDSDADTETDTVEFSAPSGFYDEEFALELKCSDQSAVIRYTTDGSIPTSDSPEYTQPIMLTDRSKNEAVLAKHTDITGYNNYTPPAKVDTCCVIRAAAFLSDNERGTVASHSYFIGFDREKLYGDVPVISIMTDEENLFDHETGIYCLGKYHDEWLAEDPMNSSLDGWQHEANYTQTGREWERPVYAEYILSDNSVGFGQDMGLRIMGGATRNESQKSMRLIARDEYGKKSIKADIIPGNERSDGQGDVEKYKSFILRNGGNDCNYQKYRDVLLQDLVKDKDFETLQSIPVVAFIDGEFWGLYSLMEDYTDNYIENNYGIDNNNVVIVKVSEVDEGTESDLKLYTDVYDFITGNDMSDTDNYKKAEAMIDMQSFCDYMAFNTYIGNWDSILRGANWRIWRVRQQDNSSPVGDGKWRFMVYDTEYSAGLYTGGDGYQENNVMQAVKGSDEAKDIPCPPEDMFKKLLENDDFRQRFILSLCDMRNISFEKSRVDAALNKYDDMYRVLACMTFDRFGPDYAKQMYGMHKEEMKKYFDNRYDVFMKHISTALGCGDTVSVTFGTSDAEKGGIIINTSKAELGSGELKGEYFKDMSITLKADPRKGKFVKWEASGCPISDESLAEITVTINNDCEITAVYE